MDYQTAQELFDALSAPFAPESIEWRVGATRDPYESEIKDNKFKVGDKVGKPLCYVDARTVMDRLDSICGPDGWQCNYSAGVNGSIVCNLGIRMPNGEWLWKADGAGATDFEGEKGMLSDALKRAAVRWGISRYLYGISAPAVKLDRGKFIGDQQLSKLADLHEKEAQKVGWGGPAETAAYRFLLRVVEETVTQPSDVAPFREKHKGMFQLLRVRARRHLEQTLDRIGSEQDAA